MKPGSLLISLLATFMIPPVWAATDAASSVAPVTPATATPTATPTTATDQGLLRFTIERYTVEGATLLSKAELDAAVAPYVGKNKDFSDVQRALEAVEAAYAKRGYTAVRVLLPEQELEKGTVRLHVVESRFGKVTVKDNHFVTDANALNAIPSVRPGSVPRTKEISQELKLANENPSRQMNVVLKEGAKDDEVDANVIVTDSKPSSWGVSLDNSGTPETGDTRLGLFYSYANLFDKDNVAGLQYMTSPQYLDRVKVVGATYKVPFYQSGSSLEFFGGYSNVNSVVGGFSNFQGGGRLFTTRYNIMLDRLGVFDPRLTFGLDWRDFQQIEQSTPPVTVLYNEIVVVPVSVAYSARGKFIRSDMGFNVSLSANVPDISKGKSADFAAYDPTGTIMPDSRYRVFRYGADYAHAIGSDWQLRAALNGQKSSDVLVLGEQIRLGGADGVRGFIEGSEGGDSGARLNLEWYTPEFGRQDINSRALAFFDAGQVTSSADSAKTTISSAGIGIRAKYKERFSLRCDVARIGKAGTDPTQVAGDWRAHASLVATF
ncbi:MAG: ShlB/FhaC/HecB family hemolysin secretion/activation protein [Gallionella sp.]